MLLAANSKRLAVGCIGGSTVVAWSNDAFAAASPTKPAAGQVTPGVGQQLSSAVVPHRYLPDYGKYHPNLVVVDSRALKALFTILRDESTIHLDFAAAADRLMRILAEEGLAQVRTRVHAVDDTGSVGGSTTSPVASHHGHASPHTTAVAWCPIQDCDHPLWRVPRAGAAAVA